MAQSPLIKRLRIKPGQRIIVINPPPGYLDQLGDLPEGVGLANQPEDVELASEPEGVALANQAGETFDFVHLFVKNVAELERLGPSAIHAVKHDGLLWISYPKRSSKVETDISRDVGWEVIKEAGLRPVTQVSIDAVWSALRFRPAERVGK
jgi:hypothetical protein